jgi:putative ABC transport system substrate-binding protein
MVVRRAITSLTTIVAIVLMAAPLASEAQKAEQAYRIGYLWPADRSSSAPLTEAFLQGLRELGYREGQNIVIEWRFAEGKLDKLPDMVAELIRLKADLIVAVSPQAVQAAKEATTTVPIVMVAVADPVTYGFVTSLARPGGNVTGMAFLLPVISTKRLELLREIAPRHSRVAVLWNASNPYRALDLRVLQVGARALGVTLQSLEVRGGDDLEREFEAASRERLSGLITLEDPFTIAHRTRIVDLALKHRLPAIYADKMFVQAGGLMSYGPILLENFRRGAAIVDKILKGAKAADLPVEQPTQFEFVINMKTAKALGLTIPPSLLLRADHVIE